MTELAAHGTTLPTIAVFGVGRMGTPIARNLIAAGFPVVVWNRAPERVAPLVDAGARPAESPARAAATADVMLTMLADGNAIADALDGPSGILAAVRPGTVWIQMATIGIEWTERFGRIAEEHGVEFVDAPVSGSDGPAQAGELIVLASGPPKLHSRLQPIFDAIGRKTLRLGPAGNGTRLKIALNNWLAAQVEGVAETIALTQAMGLDPGMFIDAIDGAPLGSQYSVAKGRAMIAGRFDPGFALRLAFKDVGLALDAARHQGVELPMTDAIAQRWQKAMAEHADDDVDSVIMVAIRATPTRQP
jgi:3-hydroxyisobutyrate dehydrogenase